MRQISILRAVMAFMCPYSLVSCNQENEEGERITGYKEYTLTVASKKLTGIVFYGRDFFSEVYAVKEAETQDWRQLSYIEGFDYESGYEYHVRISETNYLDDRKGEPSWTEYKLLQILSKEKKESAGLPKNFIPEERYEFRPIHVSYIVDAEQKEIVEENLKNNPHIPWRCYYLFSNDVNQWMLTDENKATLLHGSLVKNNVDISAFPESYKLLPPEGQITAAMRWTFMYTFNDADRGEYSYDVLMISSAKPNESSNSHIRPWFYEDLTAYYQNKYPEAKVKTVVVCHTVE